MLLWVVLAILTGVVLVVLLRPLARPPTTSQGRDDYGLRVYRDQLDEVRRDTDRGVLGAAEAATLQLEIERRLLAAARSRDAAAAPPAGGGWPPKLAVGSVLCLVPAAALALYIWLGAPTVPDAPLAARGSERKLLAGDGSLDMEKARTALQARLAEQPESLEGWLLLGRTDAALNRWPDARADFEKALALSNRSVEVLQDFGGLLVRAAQGTITPEAVGLFKEAAAKSPTAYEARYDLALASAQQGDLPKALQGFRALEHDAPADASWLPMLREAITNVNGGGTGAPASAAPETGPGQGPMSGAIMNLPPDERMDAIRGMVAGLASRLQDHPDDLAGWTRLGRSYLVLNEPAKSADAYAKALVLAPNDADLALGRAQALRAAALPSGEKSGEDPVIDGSTVEAYHKVLSLRPQQPEALWYLGVAAHQRGDKEEARGDWQKLLGTLDQASPEADTIKKRLAELPTSK